MNIQALLLAGQHSATDGLSDLLSAACPQVSILSPVHSLASALETITRLRPEIVFLDLDSIEPSFLEQLEQANFDHTSFVVVAEREDYARRAYRFNTVGYLLKPLCEEDLSRTVEKIARQKRKSPVSFEDVDRILSAKRGGYENMPALSLAVSDGILFIPLPDIRFIRADGPYSEIHYAQGKQVLIAKPLKELTARLNHLPFDRVHNSYLVNLTFVEKMHRDGYLILRNQERVDVSRANRQRVMKTLMELNGF
ncbi:MAG: LytR/AlgR family response regulator transcription factor [Saprospiraceae bacterium]